MKILIKGAGDLATGIASRLYRSGHQIIMTEIEVPLTVRRMVSLSRAVYEGEAVVEDMRGVLVSSMKEALPDSGWISARCNHRRDSCKEKFRDKNYRRTVSYRCRPRLYGGGRLPLCR